jgi:mannose-6-phosphate isomerase-like protein (cupin superfamily)
MYQNVVVNKPWGYEYLCYQNEVLAIWLLFIQKNHKTSLHCHPNKHTGLVVLDGTAEVSFLRGSKLIKGLEKIHIFKSRFHSTKATSDNGVFLLEVETPEDKHDLLRLDDSYGRKDMSYEGKEFESKKDDSCLWLSEPGSGITNFKNCKIQHLSTDIKEELYGFSGFDFFVVSRGGIWAKDENSQVLRPSDVIDGVSLERLLREFKLIPGSTFIHINKEA